ncbi:hypothetical protein SAMN05444817_104101 [Corynebacterium appendicis CIP 107643]|uniref:Uncharacterized protein n=1 Tax=Corynebacterium appendicis CIP 107643 TaxID=1161099 RepID=A0A1N7J778_9CORY|nr:hypothetical protein [Corynebacterium appendicis]WJY61879.1 hypothetical protein CAPP_09955 [Corynebacterium appendicis CIP 107643]SIS45169.1 hypothetical protein SAMN05444817_104101 [Corynebacterium appendicis CIP 107643]
MEFIQGSSDFASAIGTIWEPIYSFMKPLVTAADGLATLLGLLP